MVNHYKYSHYRGKQSWEGHDQCLCVTSFWKYFTMHLTQENDLEVKKIKEGKMIIVYK